MTIVYHATNYTNGMVHRLRNLLHTLGDILLPRRAEVALIADETPSQFIRFYKPHWYHDIIVLSDFQKTPVRAAIHATKFYNSRHGAQLLAHLLDQQLAALSTTTVLVALPLSPKRERERGHNQIVTILSHCTHPLARTHLPLLKRTRDTTPQSHLPRAERLRNVHACFAATDTHPPTTTTEIVIIDDVVTTGATLEAAIHTLKRIYPHVKVRGIALAH